MDRLSESMSESASPKFLPSRLEQLKKIPVRHIIKKYGAIHMQSYILLHYYQCLLRLLLLFCDGSGSGVYKLQDKTSAHQKPVADE